MHEQGSTLEEAVAWISRLNDELVEVFLEEYKRVPTQWGSPTLDAHVAEYILGIAYWLRGNEAWSYEVCACVIFVLYLLPRRVNDILERKGLR